MCDGVAKFIRLGLLCLHGPFTDDRSLVQTVTLTRGPKGRLAVAAAEAVRRSAWAKRAVRRTLVG